MKYFVLFILFFVNISASTNDNFKVLAEYEKHSGIITAQYGSNHGNINKYIKSKIYRYVDVKHFLAYDYHHKTHHVIINSHLSPPAPYPNQHKTNCPIDTGWVRDYGPIFMTNKKGNTKIINFRYRRFSHRPKADDFASCFGKKMNIPVVNSDLIMDGGNIMVDSHSNLFMTSRSYEWNKGLSKEAVLSSLKSDLNVNKVHVLPYIGAPGEPLDGTGHIDMIVKLLDDETVVIAKAKDDERNKTLEKIVNYFKKIKTPLGNDYRIIRMPAFFRNGTWYTYVNSLIFNNLIIIPKFKKYPLKNWKAYRIYKKSLPGYKILQVDSTYAIRSGGAVHCLAALVP